MSCSGVGHHLEEAAGDIICYYTHKLSWLYIDTEILILSFGRMKSSKGRINRGAERKIQCKFNREMKRMRDKRDRGRDR